MDKPKWFDDVAVGDTVTLARTITEADAALYIAATGDFGPVHVDAEHARGTRFGERIALFPSPFQGLDESRDKNDLLKHVIQARPEWVLWIDGDEVLERAGPERLAAVTREAAETAAKPDKRVRTRQLFAQAAATRLSELRHENGKVAEPGKPGLVICGTANINAAREVPPGQGGFCVTFDADYLALHQSGVSHGGIAWCPAQKHSIGQLIQALLLIQGVLDREMMHNHVENL